MRAKAAAIGLVLASACCAVYVLVNERRTSMSERVVAELVVFVLLDCVIHIRRNSSLRTS